MPVLVEPDSPTVASLLRSLPAGSHGVNSPDRMRAWLDTHPDEYAAVLGPDLLLDAAIDVCEQLRIAHPTVSVILVRDVVDAEVLTRAMKAGARDVVAGDDLTSISAAIQRAHQLHVALRGPAGAVRQGKVITVFSPKGGVGKTTVAVNLALALTEKGARKVCLVDLDLAFGDVAITMQLFPTHSIEQAVGSEDSIDQAMLDGLLTRHKDSLMVLAAPAHPDVRERVTPVLISRILRTLKEEFDHVVVDTAPTFDDITLTALDETDECIILATLDVPTLKNVKVALETLDLLNVSPGHRHLLLNRADDAVGITVDKVETILGMPVAVRIGTDVAIAAATNAGTPIIADQPAHPSSVAVAGLAALLAGEAQAGAAADHGGEESPEGRKRRFGRKGR